MFVIYIAFIITYVKMAKSDLLQKALDKRMISINIDADEYIELLYKVQYTFHLL